MKHPRKQINKQEKKREEKEHCNKPENIHSCIRIFGT